MAIFVEKFNHSRMTIFNLIVIYVENFGIFNDMAIFVVVDDRGGCAMPASEDANRGILPSGNGEVGRLGRLHHGLRREADAAK